MDAIEQTEHDLDKQVLGSILSTALYFPIQGRGGQSGFLTNTIETRLADPIKIF